MITTRPATILIVDDDADLRSALSDILRDEGYETREAINGLDALMCIENDEPDVMLIDLALPVLDGWELIERLQRERRSIPTIVLSPVPLRGLDYVQKPLSLDRLLRLLDEVRTRSRRRQRVAEPVMTT